VVRREGKRRERDGYNEKNEGEAKEILYTDLWDPQSKKQATP